MMTEKYKLKKNQYFLKRATEISRCRNSKAELVRNRICGKHCYELKGTAVPPLCDALMEHQEKPDDSHSADAGGL